MDSEVGFAKSTIYTQIHYLQRLYHYNQDHQVYLKLRDLSELLCREDDAEIVAYVSNRLSR